MKVHVIHDVNGNIKSLLVAGPDFADQVGVRTKEDENEQMTIVVRPDLEGQPLYQHLREIGEKFRIDTRTNTLVQK